MLISFDLKMIRSTGLHWFVEIFVEKLVCFESSSLPWKGSSVQGDVDLLDPQGKFRMGSPTSSLMRIHQPRLLVIILWWNEYFKHGIKFQEKQKTCRPGSNYLWVATDLIYWLALICRPMLTFSPVVQRNQSTLVRDSAFWEGNFAQNNHDIVWGSSSTPLIMRNSKLWLPK